MNLLLPSNKALKQLSIYIYLSTVASFPFTTYPLKTMLLFFCASITRKQAHTVFDSNIVLKTAYNGPQFSSDWRQKDLTVYQNDKPLDLTSQWTYTYCIVIFKKNTRIKLKELYLCAILPCPLYSCSGIMQTNGNERNTVTQGLFLF